jgi:hypothetical protein
MELLQGRLFRVQSAVGAALLGGLTGEQTGMGPMWS